MRNKVHSLVFVWCLFSGDCFQGVSEVDTEVEDVLVRVVQRRGGDSNHRRFADIHNDTPRHKKIAHFFDGHREEKGKLASSVSEVFGSEDRNLYGVCVKGMQGKSDSGVHLALQSWVLVHVSQK